MNINKVKNNNRNMLHIKKYQLSCPLCRIGTWNKNKSNNCTCIMEKKSNERIIGWHEVFVLEDTTTEENMNELIILEDDKTCDYLTGYCMCKRFVWVK